jgi:hypothetical protein
MKPQTVEESALYYLSLGWSVIPVRPRDKRPAIRWMEYQHRRASENEGANGDVHKNISFCSHRMINL